MLHTLAPAYALAVAASLVGARADADDGDLWLSLEGRITSGIDDVSSLRLWHASAGIDWRVAPTLALQARIPLVVWPDGRADLGDGADLGVGGELGLRLFPLPDAAVRPYLLGAVGLLFFPDGPFLPGGDIYEAQVSFGLGLELALDAHWMISAHAHWAHLSNGQGLGPHNPAYDGAGVTLGLSHRLTTTAALPRRPRGRVAPGRAASSPGGLVDLTLGEADGELLGSCRVRVVHRLIPHLIAQLDVEAGTLASEALGEVGLDLALQLAPVTVGNHFGYRSFVGFDLLVVAIQVEAHLGDEASLVALGHFEHEADARLDDLFRAAIGLRVAPFETFVVELGVAFDRIGRAAGDTSDPYLGLEWQLPLHLDGAHLALFVDRQASTLDTVGIRLYAGLGPTLHAANRNEGWRRLR